MDTYKKKYEDALERARKLQENSNGMILKKWLWNIFPELTESEDERMWKLIKKYVHSNISDMALDADHITRNQLESWLEKQSKQKSADKVESKFKVGDWVVRGKTIAQILDIQEQYYVGLDIDGNDFTSSRFLSDDKIHLWTIADAKDGDILCTHECDEPKIVFILKGTPKKHYALSYHCYYNIMYPHFASDSEKGCLAPNDEDVKPAAKEQRDFLFEKMKKAEYEWDAEKKELKKK